jgi:hypothetical protein
VFRKALIAAIVGITCGAAAGYWSQPVDTRHAPPPVAAATAPIAAPARPVGRPGAAPAPVQSLPQPQMRTEPASHGVTEYGDAVRRARVLALRPDVTGLVALRDEVLRRAEDAGEQDSPATKQQLDEIDRYLTEAQAFRLKLDAAEFRKGTAARTLPR